MNARQGNSDAILDWIEAHELPELEKIEPLRGLALLIMGLDLGFVRQSERYLSVLEMLDLYMEHTADFKKALERKLYLKEKTSYVESFRAFNSTWKDIRPRERDNKLVVEFPKAHNISNGQRDILCLVAHLEVARRKLKKQACVLVIDEVFDYLDEGNLVAAQYYITEFIEDFRKQNRRIYPLILTHLNPGYFKNFSFNKMKTYYLDARVGTTSASFRNLIINRQDPSIEDDVSRYLLHFHIDTINKRQEFHALGLRQTWGEGANFVNYLDGEMAKYIKDLPNYDPYAVCCSLRRRVEENVYKMIPGVPEQHLFLETHTTVAKLEYAENLGISVPEYYYILANVYNEGMHWRADRDNESPLKAKFDNGVIRKLIHDVFS